MFPLLYFFGGKMYFSNEIECSLCGSPGLARYRASGSKPENCMVATGPLLSFFLFQTVDHNKHSNFTMVTCFIPSASHAPTVQDSWHSIYLARQFEHADQLLFIFHSVLWRKALWIEKMVQEHADENLWLGMSVKVCFKWFSSVTPHRFLWVCAMQACPLSVRWLASYGYQLTRNIN